MDYRLPLAELLTCSPEEFWDHIYEVEIAIDDVNPDLDAIDKAYEKRFEELTAHENGCRRGCTNCGCITWTRVNQFGYEDLRTCRRCGSQW
jgi:hypothetical protein